MRRCFAYLLTLSVLATNVVWSMDDCSLQYSNKASGVALAGSLSPHSTQPVRRFLRL